MLQYLLNATCIWLLSLVIFDLFLRGETFHNYNRAYLLLTFLLGIFLPLVSWSDDAPVYAAPLYAPLTRISDIKQNIIAATTPQSITLNWQFIIFAVYLLGVFIALCVLLLETGRLIQFYRKGIRSKEGHLVIIETGKDHAPFSLLKNIFVSSKQAYTQEEWAIVIDHEDAHKRLLHFLDLLLMQLSCVIFWFHPLVYAYNKRLLMVHEYLADAAAAQAPSVYSRFLIAQSLLGSTSVITHSFNRSPIKNRIIMLTKRSSVFAKSRLLLAIPLFLICFFCFTQKSFSFKFERKGNTITYKGNTFELLSQGKDTIIIQDPVTGKEETRVTEIPAYPTKMNGQKVYKAAEVTTAPEFTRSFKSYADYLKQGLQKDLEQLSDGFYDLNLTNLVIGTDGKLVYFKYAGIGQLPPSDATLPVMIPDIPATLKNTIDHKAGQLLDHAPTIKPASVNSAIVPCLINQSTKRFEIKNHKILWDAPL